MIHTIKTGERRAFEIEPSGNKKMVMLAICQRDNNGQKRSTDALEVMDYDTCQALIFALTETAERIRAAA